MATQDPTKLPLSDPNSRNIEALAAAIKSTGWTNTPSANTGIVGSASPVLERQANDATNVAGNNLTAGTQNTTGGTNTGNNNNGGLFIGPDGATYATKPDGTVYQVGVGGTGTGDAIARQTERLLNAQELSYNAALAAKNQKYGQLQQDLQQDYQKSLQVATNQAISLNPYSKATQSTTANNFSRAITDKYNQASARLQQQADIAQQQLEAGNYQAYVQIQNSMEQGLLQAQKEANQMLLDMQKQAEQTRQFELG